MKKFNKNAALNKLSNNNNSKTKKRTIIISVIVLVGAILYFSFARFESNASFSLIDGTANIQSIPLIDKILDLKAKGASDLEFDGVETLGVNGTDDNNLRYVGANPNNYIEFNGELWRIIGLMNNIEKEDGTTDSFIKIRNFKGLGGYSWDTSDSSINNGHGIDQWGESTYLDGTPYEGADLMRELNNDYLGNIVVGTDGYWYASSKNGKTLGMPSSILSENAKSLIQIVKWNLGSPSFNNGVYDSNYVSDLMPGTSYIRERTNLNIICSGNENFDCDDNVNRTSMWTGKVGLIYPSDYGYATGGGGTVNRETCLNTSMYGWKNLEVDDCTNNDWLYSSFQWTLSPLIRNKTEEFVIGGFDFDYFGNYTASQNFTVYPVIYLKNNLLIRSGDGTETNPYRLTL